MMLLKKVIETLLKEFTGVLVTSMQSRKPLPERVRIFILGVIVAFLMMLASFYMYVYLLDKVQVLIGG